jgi:ACS family glucarate transporter-like MFS transporter
MSQLLQASPPSTQTPVTHPRGRMTIVHWLILALLFLISFVAYVLRTNMSIAGERMMGELGLSLGQLGTVLGAFAWGYAIFQFPGGVFGQVLGARKALTFIAVAWGVLNLLVGLVPGSPNVGPMGLLGSLIVLRFLMGAAQAPLYPVMGGGTICNWFPVSNWAFPNGLTNAGLTLGSAATGPLVAWLMETDGWRHSFIVTAPLAFVLAGVWWWYARDAPADHPGVSQDELDIIDADRPPPTLAECAKGSWKVVLRNREVLLLAFSYFCSNYLFYFFFNWLYIYLVQSRGFAMLEGGYYAAAPWLTGALGAVVGGWGCDRLTRRIGLRWGYAALPITGLVLGAALILAAAWARDPVLAVVYLSLCLGCQQLTEGAFWGATIAVAGRRSCAACGVLNTGGNVVGGLGALLVSNTVEAVGWPAALVTTSAFALVGALLWLFIRSDRPLADMA